MPPKRKYNLRSGASDLDNDDDQGSLPKRQRQGNKQDNPNTTSSGKPRCQFIGVGPSKDQQCKNHATKGRYCWIGAHADDAGDGSASDGDNPSEEAGSPRSQNTTDDGEAANKNGSHVQGKANKDVHGEANANDPHKTPSPNNQQGNIGANQEDEVDSRLELLARAEGLGFTAATPTGEFDTLRVQLDVYSDPRWATHLYYWAQIDLVDVNTKIAKNIGHIHASRVSKPTERQPHITNQWTTDWLQDFVGTPEDKSSWEALSQSLQAVYDRQGNPRKEVVEEHKAELGDKGNDLVYISIFQFHAEFTGKGYGPIAMNTFYRLLWLLPAWYNVGSPITVILMPGEIQNEESHKYWDARAPILPDGDDETPDNRRFRVTLTLLGFYTSRRMNFSVYADGMVVPIDSADDPNVASGYVDILGRQVEHIPPAAGDHLLPLPPPGPARRVDFARISASSASPSPYRHRKGKLRINPGAKAQSKPQGKMQGKPLGKSMGKLHQSIAAPLGGDPVTTPFPNTVDALLAPLNTLAFIQNQVPTDDMHETLRSANGRARIWGHWLDTDDELYALNIRPWLAAVIEYSTSVRPANNAEALAVDPARSMAWILTHMAPRRQLSMEQFILRHDENDADRAAMQLQAAQVIRTSLETMPLTMILGHSDDIEGAGDDVAEAEQQWRALLAVE